MIKLAYLGFSAAALTLSAVASQAQIGTTSADTAAANGDQLAEVIVTAEKRAVDAQRLPVSVLVFSGAQLEERNIRNIDDLQYQAPSLSYQDQGGVQYFNIRGVGVADGSPNQTDGVATHLDGTLLASGNNLGDAFFDLADVEVLRGPQGTYSGQNASGGAVFINSVKPILGSSGGFANVTIGNYNRRNIGAALDVPLVGDVLAARLSVEGERVGGYYTNIAPNGSQQYTSKIGDLNRYLGRAQLLFKPVDNLEARLIYQFSDRATGGLPQVPMHYQRFSPDAFPNGHTLSEDANDATHINYNRITGIMNWDFSDVARLHVAESYQNLNLYVNADADFSSPITSPLTPQSALVIFNKERYSTGEVDLLSTGAGPFEWTTGFTYVDYDEIQNVYIPAYNLNPTNNPALPPNVLTEDYSQGALHINSETLRTNQAFFGELGYHFSQSWEVKVGARYNRDKNGTLPNSYLSFGGECNCVPNTAPGASGFIPVPLIPNGNASLVKQSAETGRVLVNWTPTGQELVYFTVSRGYKPGGETRPAGADIPYKAEFVTNYELGWKANFLDRHVNTSIDAFHMDYKGYQISYATDINNPSSAITQNVNGTKINGVEAQAEMSLSHWRVDGDFSYLDAKYGHLDVVSPAGILGPNFPAAPSLIDIDGRQISYAPKVSGNIGVTYDLALPNGATLSPSVRGNYMGSQWSYYLQTPYNFIPVRRVLDVRLGYKTSGPWNSELYMTNALNAQYAQVTGSGASATYNGSFHYGPPREYGVRLSYHF